MDWSQILSIVRCGEPALSRVCITHTYLKEVKQIRSLTVELVHTRVRILVMFTRLYVMPYYLVQKNQVSL